MVQSQLGGFQPSAQCRSWDPTLAMYKAQSRSETIGSLLKQSLLVCHFYKSKLHVPILGHNCAGSFWHMHTQNFRHVQAKSDQSLAIL